MNRLLLLFTALLLLAANRVSAEEKPLKGDLAKMQGTWKATVGPEKSVTIRVTFDGTASTFAQIGATGKEVTSKGEIKLDESAQPHKTIDWINFVGPAGGKSSTIPGIYERYCRKSWMEEMKRAAYPW